MEIWLQSQDNFRTLARLDAGTGAYTLVDRYSLGPSEPPRCDGIFSMLSGKLAGLYRLNDQLMFRLGGDVFELTDQTAVEVSGPDSHRVLQVMSDGKAVAIHVYKVSARRFADDPTPMIEDEDFDFGLLASNISKSGSRKNVMLGLE